MSTTGTNTGPRRRAPAPPRPAPPRKDSTQQSYDELKLKFLTADRNYETLKHLARKALLEFEEVKRKYSEEIENHRKEREAHEKTRQHQHELEEKFEKLKSSEF